MTSAEGPVLVTGGTGSFGSTMVRRLLQTDIDEIRILSRDEAKQDAMRRELADGRVKFHVGDVRDPRSVEDAVHGVRHVFHAAALKQVPSCEFFPQQAVQTNVQGSDNVIRAPQRAGVAVGGVPEHRQGRLPDQRHGHLQGDDGEGGAGPRAQLVRHRHRSCPSPATAT